MTDQATGHLVHDRELEPTLEPVLWFVFRTSIDTSHGFVHFDRLYRRDQPKDPIEVDVWEAAELLATNWRRYARSHDRAHGT